MKKQPKSNYTETRITSKKKPHSTQTKEGTDDSITMVIMVTMVTEEIMETVEMVTSEAIMGIILIKPKDLKDIVDSAIFTDTKRLTARRSKTSVEIPITGLATGEATATITQTMESILRKRIKQPKTRMICCFNFLLLQSLPQHSI